VSISVGGELIRKKVHGDSEEVVFIENGFVYIKYEMDISGTIVHSLYDLCEKVWPTMLEDGRKRGLTDKEINEKFSEISNALELAIFKRKRDDLLTPHRCTAEIEAPDVGAPLNQLEAYAEEFRKLIEEMFEKLPSETRVLEGTEIPTYDELYQQTKNELSETNDKEDNGECSGNGDS